MSPQQQTLLIFAGIAAVLVVASLTGFLLQRRYSEGPSRPVIDNLNSRIKAWWLMVVVIGAALALGRVGVITLFALVSVAALREFITLTPTRRGDHRALCVSFFLVLPLQYVLIGLEWYGMFAILIPVYAFLFLPILSALSSDTKDFMQRTSEMQWGLMIAVYCISHVPALLTLRLPGYEGRHALLLIFLILIVQGCDVLQYVWGKLFGQRKIAPGLSPSKTVEGFLGGVASATVLGTALWWITPFNPGQAGGMAFIITLMGFLGGLVMSAIKRDRGVKDWGNMIEGHGGMLDRLDSVCFSAPVFFHLTRYFFSV